MKDKWGQIMWYRILTLITALYGLGTLLAICGAAYIKHGFQNLYHMPACFAITIVLLTTCVFAAKKLLKLEKEYFSDKQ
jgi:hypothetical protein